MSHRFALPSLAGKGNFSARPREGRQLAEPRWETAAVSNLTLTDITGATDQYQGQWW